MKNLLTGLLGLTFSATGVGRRRRNPLHFAGRRTSRKMQFEALEERAMLSVTLFLDFGGGFSNNNTLHTTAEAFRNIDVGNVGQGGIAGNGLYGNGTGTKLIGLGPNGGMQAGSSLDMKPLPYALNYNYNGIGGVDQADIDELANDVAKIVRESLEPFDINVVIKAATSISEVPISFDENSSVTGDAYVFVVAAYTDFVNGGSVGQMLTRAGQSADGDLLAHTSAVNPGNLQDEASLVFADWAYGETTGTPGSAEFRRNLAYRLAYVATHEAFHTFTFHHTVGGGTQGAPANGDLINANGDGVTGEYRNMVTNFELVHQIFPTLQPNNYLLAKDESIIGLRDDDNDNVPNLAYVTGTGAFDKITLTRDATNINIITVTVAPYTSNSFATPAADPYIYPIDMTTYTEGEILIDGGASSDRIEIDANIAASVRIRGMRGDDEVVLNGKGASALRSFVFEGEAGNDTLTIDYSNGDPLPMAGFDFRFIGGDATDFVNDTDVTRVREVVGGDFKPAYFVNTLTDAVDAGTVRDGKADADATAFDLQTTLRSAIQEANASAAAKTYIFLPAGVNTLTVGGSNNDAAQGDLDILKNVVVIGTGPGLSVIDGGGLADRIFDVAVGGVLNVSRVTLELGHAPNTSGLRDGGAVRVQSGLQGGVPTGGQFNLDYSAVVSNATGRAGNGGAIYFGGMASGSITNTVITVNSADGEAGGVYLADNLSGAGGVVSVGSTIIVNNSGGTSTIADAYAGYHRQFSSLNYNRIGHVGSYDSAPGTAGFTGSGDYVNQNTTVHYVVTSVVDSFDGSNDATNMSLRDAISLANATPGTQEVWLPAWDFVLSLQRDPNVHSTDTEPAYGDLDITDSLIIRGIGPVNQPTTHVAWMPGAVADKVFELVGDYDNDRDVDGDDFLLWQRVVGNSPPDLSADGNDDGVVNSADLNVWLARVGNILTVDSIDYV